jgi:hypothetical protein
MTDYYNKFGSLSYQHHLHSLVEELQFRLTELVTACKRSIEFFDRSEEIPKGERQIIQYRFGSLLGMVQTFKDVLPPAMGADFDWDTFFSLIRYNDLIQQVRNAVIHDGYQSISMYVEGQYFIPVGVERKGQGKNKLKKFEAPPEDIETIALKFVQDFSSQLAARIRALPPAAILEGPPYEREWFNSATRHPVVARFNIPTIGKDQFQKLKSSESPPLIASINILDELAEFTLARLSSLAELSARSFF